MKWSNSFILVKPPPGIGSHMVDSLDVFIPDLWSVQQTNLICHIGIIDVFTAAHLDGFAVAEGSLSQFRRIQLILGRIVDHTQDNLFLNGQSN